MQKHRFETPALIWGIIFLIGSALVEKMWDVEYLDLILMLFGFISLWMWWSYRKLRK
jgi:hypothetical protein